MAQAGIHGLAGALIAREGRASERGAAKYGFVLGSIVPDVDLFLMGPVYLFNSRWGSALHRSFTHSLITAAAVALVAWLWGRRRNPGFALGLGLGMAFHASLDVLVWFSGVGLFWPLGAFGLMDRVNIWAGYTPPEIASKLLGAAEPLALAVYFAWLGRTALSRETDLVFLPRLRRLAAAQWAAFAAFAPLAFALRLPYFNLALYALFIPVLFPMALYVTSRMRATIEAL